MLKRKNIVLASLAMVGASLVAGSLVSAADYTVDGAHSSVAFKVKRGAFNIQGLFGQVSGKATIDESAEKTKFDFTVKAESITTGNEARDKHLRNADFFNVGQFPEIKFVSKEVKASATGYDVKGDLTMLGQTKPVTVTLTKVGDGKGQKGEAVVGYEAAFEIDRSEFGMKYGAGMIDNKVKLTAGIALTGTK
jgi:polyisoprenoid-binding protein YceI